MGLIRSVSLGVTVMFIAALPVSAQDKPDFTGTWTRIAPSASSDSSYVERVVQKGNEITVHVESKSSFGSMGGMYSGERTYTIGGSLEPKKDPEGRVRSVAVSWDGPHLVFLRTTTEGANVTTERESWSLSADGTKLTKERETTDWRGATSERVVFQRSPGHIAKI